MRSAKEAAEITLKSVVGAKTMAEVKKAAEEISGIIEAAANSRKAFVEVDLGRYSFEIRGLILRELRCMEYRVLGKEGCIFIIDWSTHAKFQ